MTNYYNQTDLSSFSICNWTRRQWCADRVTHWT